jgi:tetratricopeptide (TPR) repeat protein
LKGRFFWNKRTEDSLKKAIEFFRQAIEIDPTYALAYAGIADCYGVLNFFGDLPPKESATKAAAAVKKALEIDDTIAEVHTSLGLVNLIYDWDWQKVVLAPDRVRGQVLVSGCPASPIPLPEDMRRDWVARAGNADRLKEYWFSLKNAGGVG